MIKLFISILIIILLLFAIKDKNKRTCNSSNGFKVTGYMYETVKNIREELPSWNKIILFVKNNNENNTNTIVSGNYIGIVDTVNLNESIKIGLLNCYGGIDCDELLVISEREVCSDLARILKARPYVEIEVKIYR